MPVRYVTETLSLPVPAAHAFAAVKDLDLMLRLSPHWSLRKLEDLSTGEDGQPGQTRVTLDYYAKNVVASHTFAAAERVPDQKIAWSVDGSALSEISFSVEPLPEGSSLTLRFGMETADDQLLSGTLNELRYWLRSIATYISLSGRGGIWPRLLTWFMRRVWLRLSLSERKIALIVTVVSAAELLILLLLILLWNLFGPG